MGNRNLLQAVVAMLVAFLVWYLVAQVFFPPPPRPAAPAPDEVAAPAVEPREQGAREAAPHPVSATAQESAPGGQVEPAAGDGQLRVVGASEAVTVAVGDVSTYRGGPFRMLALTDSRGAGVREVQLNDFLAKVSRQKDKSDEPRLRLLQPVVVDRSGRERLSLATEQITLIRPEGHRALDLAEPLWEVVSQVRGEASQRVTYGVTVREGERDLLRIEKTYELPVEEYASGRYDLNVELRVRNLSDGAVDFSLEQGGPVGITRESIRTDTRSLLAGRRKEGELGTHAWHRDKIHRAGTVTVGEGLDAKGEELAWVALTNQYFAAVLAPAEEEGDVFGPRIALAEGVAPADQIDAEGPTDMTFRLRTARQTVGAGQETSFRFACFIGPKERRSFESVESYKRRGYMQILTKGFSGCTFAGLAVLMVKMLTAFHNLLFHNYGLAIIILVLVVRTLLHPVTKKGQVNMVRMQSKMAVVQPKFEEIKKKYANDKAKLNEETMKLYRDHGISPASQMLTCLPMLLQMPIWVALYTALSSTVEMRQEPFVLWIRDLTAPDALVSLASPFHIPLLSGMIGPIEGLNILPILLSLAMYLQQRFMPKAAQHHKRQSKTEDQLEQQQKIMKYMMLMMGLLFYNAPSGLNLYIMSSTFFGVIEQWRIRQHIKAEEAKGTMQPPSKPKPPEGPKKMNWIEKLAKKAEEAQRLQSKRDGRRRA